VVSNGAYGRRMVQMAKISQIPVIEYAVPENIAIPLDELKKRIHGDRTITHVAVVHCETSTGIFNPIDKIGNLVEYAPHRPVYIVDAMSSFGAVPFSLKDCKIHFMVSSANKCIQGIPGFGVILADKNQLNKCKDNARSLSLDLYSQWKGLNDNGQFRFTPPTHSILAFKKALEELSKEDRGGRYQKNYELVASGMKEMGFIEYLPKEIQGYIITAFNYPTHKNFNFETFYEKLYKKGFVIYPGKTTSADCFRIGNIGHIFPADINKLLKAIAGVKKEMQF